MGSYEENIYESEMANPSPVSDTQNLLQSMLQKLKLQGNPERNTTNNIQDESPSSPIEINGHTAGSQSKTLVYQFGDQQGKSSIWTNQDNPWTVQSSAAKRSDQSSKEVSTTSVQKVHSPRVSPSIWYINDSTVSEETTKPISHIQNNETPKWKRKQLKFSLKKQTEDNASVSSLNTPENTLNYPNLPTPSPSSPSSTSSPSELQASTHFWSENAGGNKMDNINTPDQMTRTRTSSIGKRKWWDPGQKRWAQKVKERWKDRHRGTEKKEREENTTQEQNEVMGYYPNPPENNKSTTNTSIIEEEKTAQQQQPISNGADEALDHMSESTFSFGSFNLMEEIFTSEEWAKFCRSSTSSPSDSSFIPQDKTLTSTVVNQWDYREALDQSFQQDMDTTEHTSIQTKTSHFSLSLDQTFELFKGQIELFDLNSEPLQSMDLGLGQSESNGPAEDHSQFLDVQVGQEKQASDPNQSQAFNRYQSQASELNISHASNLNQSQASNLNQSQASDLQQLQAYNRHQSQASNLHQSQGSQLNQSEESNLNQSQASDLNQSQPERRQEELMPTFDSSYLQVRDWSSLRGSSSQSRKRGHTTLRRYCSDGGRGETGEEEERRDAVIPLTPLQTPPKLSPALLPPSTSSLHNSVSQDSESSEPIETVVKKRRLENTRRVRFAEEVTILPVPVLYEEEEEDEGDDDYYNNNDEEDDDEDDEDEEDDEDVSVVEDDGECGEEPQSRSSASNWISALRSMKKHRFKLPHISSTPTKLRSLKKS